jgi:hypothetical protein
MKFYELLLGALALWRIAHLLVAEDGPFDISARLRRRAGQGLWGRLLDCFYCLSLWLAAPLALVIGATWRERLLLWPALSAGAVLLQRVLLERSGNPTAPYWEDSEVSHGMLRKEPPKIDGSETACGPEKGGN